MLIGMAGCGSAGAVLKVGQISRGRASVLVLFLCSQLSPSKSAGAQRAGWPLQNRDLGVLLGPKAGTFCRPIRCFSHRPS